MTLEGQVAHKQTRGPWLIGAVLAMGMCLCAWGGGWALQANLRGRPPGVGHVVQVCVGVNTTPRWQVGVTWISPYFSSLPPVRLQQPACALLPWLPGWPQRGGFALP